MIKSKIPQWVAPLLVAVCGLIFNATIGTLVALLLSVPAWMGAVVALLVTLCVGVFYRPGRVHAGVFQEVYTGEILKQLREDLNQLGWYSRIPSYDEHANNDVIHFVELGGDPKVLIDNNTYPLSIHTVQDADRGVTLALHETEATAISDKELATISYDKLGSVQERHKLVVAGSIRDKAIHSLAPQSHSEDNSPVLLTTGATAEEGGRKKLTIADLLRLKKWCDKRHIPQGERVLVLCPDHVQDLLSVSENFVRQYNLDTVNGSVARLYGFDMYEWTAMPYYNTTDKSKLAYGAIPQSNHKVASVFFHDKSMMRALGSLKIYFSKAENDPIHHRNLYNLAQRAICAALRSKGCTAAIVSAAA